MNEVYLNHAGTSWPKPEAVRLAMAEAINASPQQWRDQFYESLRTLKEGLQVPDSGEFLIAPGGTSALATAISDFPLQPGDRVLTSHFEHHALHRPLLKRSKHGVVLEYVPATGTSLVDLEYVERSLKQGGVKLIAMTSACNVTGDQLPIDELIRIARQNGTRVLIDASQTIGWSNETASLWQADLVAFAGHKGLQAPWGIGGLFIREGVAMETPAATCESESSNGGPCTLGPGYCDLGSVDRIALAGASAASEWLRRPAQTGRLETARQLIRGIQEELASLADIRLVGFQTPEQRLPTLAFVDPSQPTVDVAQALTARGLTVGAGYQCAPLAHQALGTAETGVIRLSVGPEQGEEVIDALHVALQDALKKR